MRRIFFLVLILFAFLHRASAETTSQFFNRANQLYEEGKYDEAIAEYSRIIDSGIENGIVYYNLGKAYFKTNQLGRAILSYERASRLMPRDQDVRANLEFVRLLTVDKIEIPQPGWITQLLTDLFNLFNLPEITIIVWILYIILCALAILFILTHNPARRRTAFHVGTVILVMFVVTGISLTVKIAATTSTELAIVMVSKVDARSGPGDEYTKIFTIHEGTKARIRQSREGWHLISIPGGTGGWIQANAVERI